MSEGKAEKHLRQNLRGARAMGGLGNPGGVALLHGTLAGYARRGVPVSKERFCTWAAEEGWPLETLPVLRGIAYAADNATPNLGELTTSRADDGQLQVHLTSDEARLAHAALREILLGPYRVPDDEFDTLTGFRRDEAEVLLNALHDGLRRT